MQRAFFIIGMMFFCLSTGLFAQNEGSFVRSRLLIGKWKLVNHWVELDMPGPYQAPTDVIPRGFTFTYEFFSTRTYLDDIHYGVLNYPTIKHAGRWEFIAGGDTILLTRIHEFPSILDTELPQQKLPVLKLTETELVIPEHIFRKWKNLGLATI